MMKIYLILQILFMTQAIASPLKEPIIPPLSYTPNKNLNDILYPDAKIYNEGYLKVSGLHKIWYGEYGNPEGIPVIVLHGGPGAGIDSKVARFFDPNFYRVILFDQRGAGKSTPGAEMDENNTQNLITDIESLRKHLDIDKWLVFGGSWGSTLAITYGEEYPDRCIGFVLRGIFLGSREEAEQLWYGVRESYPEYWQQLLDILPENEREDLIAGYYKKIMDPDSKVHMKAAKAFITYDLKASFALQSLPDKILDNDHFNLNVTRAFTHYFMNNFFLKPNQLIDNIHKISHLPAIIVHGRQDLVCRTRRAYELFQAWPGSELIIVQDGGHAGMELPMANQLIRATDKFKNILKHK